MKYTGTVVFVSHDRYFIDKLATRVFEIGDGKWRSTRGITRIICGGSREEVRVDRAPIYRNKLRLSAPSAAAIVAAPANGNAQSQTAHLSRKEGA